MNILDIRTILFSYVITNAICAAVMASLWRQNRRRSPELSFWLVDFILQFVAVLLIALRGILPDFISVFLGTPLVITGTLLLYIGLERYTGKTSSQLHNYILLGIMVVIHAYFTFIQPSLQARNVIFSLGLLAICSQCAWLLLHRVEPAMRPGKQAVGVVFVVYSVVSILRVFIDLAIPSGNNLFQSGLYDTLAILIYQMVFIGLTFALFLMVNQRFFGELESDITTLNLAQEALKASETRYRRLFEAAHDGVLIIDAETGQVLDVNPFLEKLLGYSHEIFLGKKLWEIGPFKDITASREAFQELQTKGYIRYEDLPLETADGRRIEVEFVSNVYLVDHTKVIQSNIRDITERKQAEAKNAQLAAIVESSEDAIIGKTLEGVITSWNKGAERIYGYSKNEAIGKSVSILIPPEQEDDLPMILEKIKSGEYIEHYETLRRRKNGQDINLSLSVSPIRDSESRIVAASTIGRDITEKKKAEDALNAYSEKLEQRVDERTRELRQAQDKLVRQEKLATLGQLAGSVSHELRNPLGVISNAVYFLNMSQPEADAQVKKYLDIIEKETRNADKIITDLLDFSRIKSLGMEPVAVPGLVNSVMERYPAPEGVELTLKFPKDLPRLLADPHHMAQVLGNLVLNAYQAMPTAALDGGKMVISGKRVESKGIFPEEGQTYVAIAVKDSGVGIASENLGKLFEPLFTTKPTGIGLGLAICKNLVEANGGQIEVTSKPGRGSTFTVYIPIFKEPV